MKVTSIPGTPPTPPREPRRVVIELYEDEAEALLEVCEWNVTVAKAAAKAAKDCFLDYAPRAKSARIADFLGYLCAPLRDALGPRTTATVAAR